MNTDTFTTDAEVVAIGCGLLDRTLPKHEWTHRAHFAVAVWLMMYRPDIDADAALPPAIRAYNVSTGVANTSDGGYHETITRASIRAARAFVRRHPGIPAFEACNLLMQSELGRSDWLLAYWSRPLLFSREARSAWVDPDLQALPF